MIRKDRSHRCSVHLPPPLKVPLLFTGSRPTRLDDTTIRAELYRDCRPSAVYKVGIRDGLPHRINP